MKDVTGIPLRKETRTITAEDEEKALDALRHRQAELHTVTEDRETVEGDFVSVDIRGFLMADRLMLSRNPGFFYTSVPRARIWEQNSIPS